MNSKIFLVAALFCLLTIFLLPLGAMAGQDPGCKGADGNYGIVDCGCSAPIMSSSGGSTVCTNCCDITDGFRILLNIYNKITWIAGTLAGLALMVGAVLMMVSAGNPSMFENGKKIAYAAIIGLALVLGSFLIIQFILTAVGYKNIGSWNTLPS